MVKRMDTPTRIYENDEIKVYWYADKCWKAKECIMGSPEAFDMNRRPWVDIDAVSAAEMAAIIDKCPSGALRYEMKN